MIAQRDALLAARFRGVRTVEIEGRRVTFATDAEMAAAITDLERRVAPFEVVSDTKGYYSSNTMSGTRFNTKLEDLASSITVV